jgi:hypothetical protein
MSTELALSAKEIQILVESLTNCLGTCQKKAKKADAPCKDCDAALALQKKLKKHLRS